MLYLNTMKKITVYCDGSAIGNPGPGGWGAVVADSARVREIGGHAPHTTNNRMELTACIEALALLRTRAEVVLHTDSQYVINGITKWVFGWEQNGWQTKDKKEVQNRDLWEMLFVGTRKHEVTWKHVKGHSGIALNERVDVIANGFAQKKTVELFSGSVAKYKMVLANMPKARVVSKSKSKSRGGVAYSYVSCIDGQVMTHATWGECEKRVKGKNAKYKKVFSKEEEMSLTSEWSR